jgi:membrane-associated phospholipid phosphatase
MSPFFYKIFSNIEDCYRKRNLLWQFVFIILTYILVWFGLDWLYFLATRSPTIQSIFFPAVILGLFVPVFLPILLLLLGLIHKDKRMLNTMYAISQSALLGLLISSFYKVFTGRVGPMMSFAGTPYIDISHMFRFGFYRGGAFQGWPSSHTTVAFAVSATLWTLYPENKFIRSYAFIYTLYIGIGVSVTIHWFSDFMAGAILGTIIGISVGKSFWQRYKSVTI